MKNTNLLSGKMVMLVLLLVGTVMVACKEDHVFSEDYDIDLPVPTITSFTPATAQVGSLVTITGTNLDKTSLVTVGAEGVAAKVTAVSPTAVTIQLPRVFSPGPISLSTSFRRTVVSDMPFDPMYLEATITGWPREIERSQNIIIRGTNLDMVQEIDISGTKITPNASSTTAEQLIIPTTGLTLPNSVTIKISKARGKVTNGSSPAIPVKDYDPNSSFTAEQPIILYDFEDGVNPYQPGQKTAQSGINLSNIAPGRGKKFLTVKTNDADGWTSSLGSISYDKTVDLAKFHDPHLTFLINTNGQKGYFQMEIKQNDIRGGGHFTKATSSSDKDDYTFPVTNGWEWRSISLKDFPWENWSNDGKLNFDPNGKIQNLTFTFKQGNGNAGGNKNFELNLDQIMITDDKSLPAYTLFNFEDGVNPYDGKASSGINTAGVSTISGAKYLTVKMSNVNKFDWTGAIEKKGPFDLSSLKNPFLNVWVNTGKAKGYFQIETTENKTKWGADADKKTYLLDTRGEWVRYSFPIKDLGWGNWGGTGTSLDYKGVLDYVKLGFTTGNVEKQDYEISVDDITISDGPVF